MEEKYPGPREGPPPSRYRYPPLEVIRQALQEINNKETTQNNKIGHENCSAGVCRKRVVILNWFGNPVACRTFRIPADCVLCRYTSWIVGLLFHGSLQVTTRPIFWQSLSTNHRTKSVTHQTGNYPVTCFVSRSSGITLVKFHSRWHVIFRLKSFYATQ